jgi:hypothetical protein
VKNPRNRKTGEVIDDIGKFGGPKGWTIHGDVQFSHLNDMQQLGDQRFDAELQMLVGNGGARQPHGLGQGFDDRPHHFFEKDLWGEPGCAEFMGDEFQEFPSFSISKERLEKGVDKSMHDAMECGRRFGWIKERSKGAEPVIAQALEPSAHDLQVEVFLAAEVIIDGRDIALRPIGDFADGGMFEAMFGEQLLGDIEQPLNGCLPLRMLLIHIRIHDSNNRLKRMFVKQARSGA